MKKPVLEVIRFDEADIVTASGMSGLGFTASLFSDGTPKNGTFTFFGGTGEPKSVTTGDTMETIVQAFNNYFSGKWSYDKQPYGEVSRGDSDAQGDLWNMMIAFEDGDLNLDGEYFYKNGKFYSTN